MARKSKPSAIEGEVLPSDAPLLETPSGRENDFGASEEGELNEDELQRPEHHLDRDDLREPADQCSRDRDRDVDPERFGEVQEGEGEHLFSGDYLRSLPACPVEL